MAKVEIELPSEAPVMVLPLVLFPNSLMPLRIFEPRYRSMLAWALEHDRVFCIALHKPDEPETADGRHFFHTAGLGLIRACVGREDGTSDLMLHGLARARFSGFASTEPFFLAKIDPVKEASVTTDPDDPAFQELLRWADKVRGLCCRMRQQGLPVSDEIEEFLAKMDDPAVLADQVAHAFLRDLRHRQQILEEPRIRERLILLAGFLRAELDTLP